MNALLVIDVQNDFLPGGALAVPEGDRVVPVINGLIPKFDLVVATQDWHPPDHGSFADNHPGKAVGDVIELNGLRQILWPRHCVGNTTGAEFSPELNSQGFTAVIKKGTDPGIDSYSGLYDNAHRRATGLESLVRQNGVDDVYIVGLATDYCVKFTALDTVNAGFKTTVIIDACRGVNLKPNDVGDAVAEMKSHGVRVMESGERGARNREQ